MRVWKAGLDVGRLGSIFGCVWGLNVLPAPQVEMSSRLRVPVWRGSWFSLKEKKRNICKNTVG